jgi:hypothetical protein
MGAEGERETPFTVSEVLKGQVTERRLLIRELAASPPSLAPQTELIVLLTDADEADGFYRLEPGLPGTHYEVVSGRTGAWVPVNASGVDAHAVLAKDKHRQSENHELPLAEFRAIARSTEPPRVVAAPVQTPVGVVPDAAVPAKFSLSANAVTLNRGDNNATSLFTFYVVQFEP